MLNQLSEQIGPGAGRSDPRRLSRVIGTLDSEVLSGIEGQWMSDAVAGIDSHDRNVPIFNPKRCLGFRLRHTNPNKRAIRKL